MGGVNVRAATPSDAQSLAAMCVALWPNSTLDECLDSIENRTPRALPLAYLVAEDGGDLVGFVELSVRPYADGCDPSRGVGYLEGWYVHPAHRRRGIGALLVRAAEDWARAQGCTEFASGALLENEVSHRAHAALGFEEVERAVHFRKGL